MKNKTWWDDGFEQAVQNGSLWDKATKDPLTRAMIRKSRQDMVQVARMQRALEKTTLDRMLNETTLEQVHPEWDTGPAVGQEVW